MQVAIEDSATEQILPYVDAVTDLMGSYFYAPF